MLEIGIKSSGTTLDPYGPRTGMHLVKFVVVDLFYNRFGEKW